jgi:phage shock protein PspC (stress-responsive transcriptional regulator)
MNEVTRIHLGRQQFVVAVDAHKELQTYLHAIERQVGHDKEVIKEVELRMAELLTERGVSGDKVMLGEDVAFLKEQLGEPSAFGDGEEPTKEKAEAEGGEPTGAAKRLFRDTENATIAGVCAGLATFFGIDAIIVRLIFVAFTLLGGSGILIYILLWILVPAAKTNSERLQMRGKAVTVGTLKELVDRADVEGAARRAGSHIEPIITKVFTTVWRIITTILGVAMLIAAICGLVALGTLGVHIAANHQHLINGVFAFPQGSAELATLVAAMVLAGLILVLLFAAGLSVLRRKWVLRNWVTAIIGILMLVSVSVGGALAPNTISKVGQRYERTRQEVTKTLQPFDEVKLKGSGIGYRHVESDSYKVKVTYLGNINPENIHITQENNLVVVDLGNAKLLSPCVGLCLGHYPHVDVTVYAPSDPRITSESSDLMYLPVDAEFHTRDVQY